MGSEDESEGRSSRWFCFLCLQLLPLGSDDGFASYDLDDEMQGDAYNAQVDIDPYACYAHSTLLYARVLRRCRGRHFSFSKERREEVC